MIQRAEANSGTKGDILIQFIPLNLRVSLTGAHKATWLISGMAAGMEMRRRATAHFFLKDLAGFAGLRQR
jgi:hypothetical protein